MIRISNDIIPFPGYICMNICGILFVRTEYEDKIDDITINHESIHTKQILELGIIGFYIWYLIEWIVKVCRYGSFHKAYRNISLEKEAYTNEENLEYLTNRKHYLWFGMI